MKKTFREFQRAKGRGGVIAVDAKGNVSVDTTTPCILHAIRTHKISTEYP